MNIYTKLEKPIISLAPMEDVTDTVFRQVVSSLGKPDLFFTEFVNVEGLNSKGRDMVIHRLRYTEKEKPIIAQLWGIEAENFFKSAQLVREMGFDGVDINMGCSVKNVVKSSAGSGLINQDRKLVEGIIEATKQGAKGLPVSAKTRLGFNSLDMGWIEFLLKQNLSLVTINMRMARGEKSLRADWSYMRDILKLRDSISPSTLIFGNGDIKNLEEAKDRVREYGVDGVMIGRASISNPWVFSSRLDISKEEKIEVLKYHLTLFEESWGNEKDFNSLKKFFKGYINNYKGASKLRAKLMETRSAKEVREILSVV
ncbi:MAG: tRNA dihydrouridine synthase [Candidatus Dojkabacteria bacterium]